MNASLPMSDSIPLVTRASTLDSRPVRWLWPGRLACGKLSIFDGDPNMGKSLVTLDLCARLTTGRPLPDGAPAGAPANVVILNGEDSGEDTVSPRLRALGADLDRVFVFHKQFLEETGLFRLPAHSELLDHTLAQTHAVLAVLDPIMAFLDPSIQIVNDSSVRRALLPLAQLADRHGCHIALVRHLNKTGNFRSQYRGGGSIGLLAACRAAYLFARHPHQAQQSIMAPIKNNLGPLPPSLIYGVRSDPAGQPVVDWLGECPLSADQLLVAAGQKPPLPGATARACDFLTAFLETGPRSTLDIWQAAQEQGLARRTVQRAGKNMEITSKNVWANNRSLTYWLLRHQKLPPELDPKSADDCSLEPWLAPLREQFPGDPLADKDD